MKNNYFKLGALLASILALFVVFDVLIVFEKLGYTGLNIIFGKKGVLQPDLKFSIVGLIFLILLIVMVVTSVLKLLDKFKDKQKILNIILIISSVIVAVLFFVMNTPIMVNERETPLIGITFIDVTKDYKLGIGTILGGIFSLAAVGFCVADIVIKK